MRDLTPEELALAPWATHYKFDEDGDVLFESKDYCQWFIDGVLKVKVDNFEISSDATEVNRKQFDITQHEWGDDQIDGVSVEGDCLFIDDNDYEISTISINRKDAIAIAKHFKLTANDLKL